MNLGLDIDGVLTNIEEYQFKYGIPYFKKHFNKDVVNEYALDLKEIFDATEEEYKKFGSKYLFRYAIACPARKNAAEYTKWAYENGHRVYIITSRVFATKENMMGKLMRCVVRNWLKRHHIRYEEITFCDEDKVAAIRKYNIDYMVDDNPKNIEALKDETGMICMDAKCNIHITDDKVKRCMDFEQILEYVKGKADA